ncbi:MAG TPA: Zn-dependent hydrolase [Gammaproteobacteria bacterium]
MKQNILLLAAALMLAACGQQEPAGTSSAETASKPEQDMQTANAYVEERIDIYAPVTLSADLSGLSENQKAVIAKLIEASKVMDELFWMQAYGDREALLRAIEDPTVRRFAEINYGPWDRLANEKPFVEGVGEKPLGANFYPEDMTREEFDAWEQPGKTGQYSVVRRGPQGEGELILIPYHDLYSVQLNRAATLLREAADLAEIESFANYLRLRADALLTDEYQASDMAWMDMKNNVIELVYGPIESYEDRLFGYRAAYESYVLLKDLEWSERLARFAAYLPELQRGLPVPDVYKQEMPGSDAELNAYDVLYYAGHANAGAKTIAINLPNDEKVQLEKGTRRLQLKNAMRAKFEKILLPIAGMLIAEDQRKHVTFDAFFANTMFHEVAHGLGIKNTIDGKQTVRDALLEHASSIEEGKADVLGLYMVEKLHEKGELDGELMDYYTTFLASIFRSVRFGASSAHGVANMVRFNYFKDAGAFTRDEETGTYRVNAERMHQAIQDLSRLLLTLQGDGDYEGVDALVSEAGEIGPQLEADLERLAEADIPVDIVFKQGVEVLGLEKAAE